MGSTKLLRGKSSPPKKAELLGKAYNAIILSLGDKVIREISKEMTATGV